MTPEQEVRRGDQAIAVIESPIFIEAFDVVEKELTQKWQDSRTEDTEAREKIWISIKMLERVKLQLVSVATTGLMAKQSLIAKLRGQSAWPL